jgi:hypothetical protein
VTGSPGTSFLCRACGVRLEKVYEDQQYHPMCWPEHLKLTGTPMSPFELELKEDLLEVMHWINNASPRSQQKTLGCSEAGDECDRKIAYRMAGTKKIHTPDPLKANMGTAFHHWLDNGMTAYQEELVTSQRDWLTETEVWPAKFLKGHVDLYSRAKYLVLDWKTTSADILKEWAKLGTIPPKYRTQVMLYGKGMINAGYRVDRVGIVGINRSGTFNDIVVLTEEYDETVVKHALWRVYDLGKHLIEIDIDKNPHLFGDIPATPSRLCGWCPWYRGGTKPADGTGCPGEPVPEGDFDSLFTKSKKSKKSSTSQEVQ